MLSEIIIYKSEFKTNNPTGMIVQMINDNTLTERVQLISDLSGKSFSSVIETVANWISKTQSDYVWRE